MKLFSIVFSSTFAIQSFAQMNVNVPRGEEIIRHNVGAGRPPEICVVPKHLPDGSYGKSEEDERELCALNIGVNVAACGKENSTNPGVNFFSPDVEKNPNPQLLQQIVQQLQQSDCLAKSADGRPAEKDAKYKLSTSCSYSPSILGYYHMSRALGNIVNVPPAVLRTMDLGRHIAIGEKSLNGLSKDKAALIYQTWNGLISNLKQGAKSPKKALLLTSNYDQSYGALQKNPKGEEKYQPEFFNGGTDRVAAFRDNNKIYKSLKAPALSIPRQFNKNNVQAFVQLRDAADFILLDTIMGQQDRFGNIHYTKKYFYPTVNEKGEFDIDSEKKLKKVPQELQASAVEIKELMLKDNDCGVAKENRIKAAGLLNGVAHMSPKTYRSLQNFAKVIGNQEVKQQFLTEYMFTEADFKKVSDNLKEAATMLAQKCRNGELKLDLALDVHFSSLPLPSSYQCD